MQRFERGHWYNSHGLWGFYPTCFKFQRILINIIPTMMATNRKLHWLSTGSWVNKSVTRDKNRRFTSNIISKTYECIWLRIHMHDVFIRCNTITVTLKRERWRLKSPATRLFTQPFIQAQIKQNIKFLRHLPECGEFIGDRWILRAAQMASNAENVVIWWRHRVIKFRLAETRNQRGIGSACHGVRRPMCLCFDFQWLLYCGRKLLITSKPVYVHTYPDISVSCFRSKKIQRNLKVRPTLCVST